MLINLWSITFIVLYNENTYIVISLSQYSIIEDDVINITVYMCRENMSSIIHKQTFQNLWKMFPGYCYNVEGVIPIMITLVS